MLNFSIPLQRQVIAAALDDFSPNAALPELHGGQYGSTPQAWRDSVVEFIHDMHSAGLIAPLAGRENYQTKTSDELCELLRRGDFDNGLDVDLVWNALYFGGTEKLTELLKALGLENWGARDGQLSMPLGDALAKMNVVLL